VNIESERMAEIIDYKVSMRITKLWIGQNNIKKKEITFYLTKFYEFIQEYLKHNPMFLETVIDYDDLIFNYTLDHLIHTFLTERVCYETWKEKTKIPNRNCRTPYCAPLVITNKILYGGKKWHHASNLNLLFLFYLLISLTSLE